MFGVGIDVAKSKSMVAILLDDGEIIKTHFEITNTESGLSLLCKIISELSDEVFCVVESTTPYLDRNKELNSGNTMSIHF